MNLMTRSTTSMGWGQSFRLVKHRPAVSRGFTTCTSLPAASSFSAIWKAGFWGKSIRDPGKDERL